MTFDAIDELNNEIHGKHWNMQVAVCNVYPEIVPSHVPLQQIMSLSLSDMLLLLLLQQGLHFKGFSLKLNTYLILMVLLRTDRLS